jgi:hypothetical protein
MASELRIFEAKAGSKLKTDLTGLVEAFGFPDSNDWVEIAG